MMLAKFSGMPIRTQISSVTMPANNKRHQRQQHIAEPPQNDPKQNRDRNERVKPRFEECPDDRAARFKDRNRTAGGVWINGKDRARERPQYFCVVGIAFWRNFNASAPVAAPPTAV